MKDTYNDGYKTEDIKCIIVDFIAEDGKGGLPIMRQGTYVLCKDCKYLHQLPDGQIFCENKDGLPLMIGDLTADYFCSQGENR